MANPNAGFYAELDAEIYNVNAADDPLTLSVINDANAQSYRSVSSLTQGLQSSFIVPPELAQVTGPVGTPSAGVTFFYGADGFVGQVFQDPTTGQFIVAFRGTDSSASLSASVWAGLIGGATSTVDANDSTTNGKLGVGTDNGTYVTQAVGQGLTPTNQELAAPGQLNDALLLTQAVIAAAGGDPTKVTVTGQSLGGGLAGLVSAELNVKSYIFDAAPFDNQLYLQACFDVKAYLASDPQFADATVTVNNGFVGTHGPYLAVTAPDPTTQLSLQLIATQLVTQQYNLYETDLVRNSTSIRIQGEMLSATNNLIGDGVYAASLTGATDFFGIDQTALNSSAVSPNVAMAGGSSLVYAGVGDATELHSPSLIALVLGTATTATPFSSLIDSDSAIQKAFYGAVTFNGVATDIAGPLQHVRADPAEATPIGGGQSFTVTSAVTGSGPSSAGMERALLEDPVFEASFYKQFGALIDTGAAGPTGAQQLSTFTDISIHTGLVDLGLQIVRDHLNDPNNPAQQTLEAPLTLQPFGDIASQNYAIVHLSDILAGAVNGGPANPLLLTSSAFGTGMVPYGVNGLDQLFVNDFVGATNTADLNVIGQLEQNLTAWQVLIAQAGDGSMIYTPQGDDNWLSNLIFCGSNGDTVYVPNAASFIVGGAGFNTFVLGNSYSAELGLVGDGIGSTIIGVSGSDIADYANCDVAINVVFGSLASPSTSPNGVRSDLLVNVPDVIGSDNNGDVIKSATPFGSDVGHTITVGSGNGDIIQGGGGNDIIIAGTGTDDILFSGGSDTINGNSNTTFDLSQAPTTSGFSFHGWNVGTDGYLINLNLGFVDGGSVGYSALSGIQNVIGSQFGDTIIAGSNDIINAGSGVNTIYSGTGIGEINGGAGTNTLALPDPISDYAIGEATNLGFSIGIDLMGGGTLDLANNVQTFTFAGVSYSLGALLTNSALLTGTAAALPNNAGSTQVATSTGLFTYSNPNLQAVNTITYTDPPTVSNGGTIPAATLTALENALTFGPHLDNTAGFDYATWNFAIPEANLSFLAQGQVLTANYIVTITDADGVLTTVPITETITGANDAPVITSPAPAASVIVAGSLFPEAAGTFFFNDPNLLDTHTPSYSLVSGPSSIFSQGIFTDNVLADTTGTGTGGLDAWNYQPSAAELASLQDNTSVTGVYALTVTDNNGASATPQDVTIVLARGADPTILTPSASGGSETSGSGSVTVSNDGSGTPSVAVTINELPIATGSGTTDAQSGTDAFTDSNPYDTPTATVSFSGIVWTDAQGNTHTLSAAQISTIEQGLTVSPVSGNSNNGTYDWTYAIANNAIAFLGAGETVVVSADINLSDGHGGTVDTPITITINGINDPPVIAAVDKMITASITAGSIVPQGGQIAFSDPDANDLPTAAVSQFAVWFDASGNTHALTSAQLAEIEASFTIAAAGGNTNVGAINWQDTIQDSVINFLAQGEHVVLTNVVTVNDAHGGFDTSDVVITFNGTNDAPTIPTNPGVTSEIITKLANTTGSNTPDTASGTFAFNDTNLSDQHTFTHNLVSDTLSSGTVIPAATLAALTNGLSLTEVDSTGTGTGSVTWTLSAADKNFDFLAQGQSLTAVYGIGISDGHGGSVTEPVSVTINGAYAPPTITTAQLTGSVTGTSAPASGVIHFTSPELIDTHSIVSYSLLSTTAQPETASNGVSTGAIGALGTFTANLVQDSTNGATGAIDWSYNLSSLPQGSPITETWGIVMQDASGHQVTEDVAVTISQASSQLGVPVRVDTFPNGDTYNTGSGYAAMGFDLVYGPGATPSNEVGYRFVVYGSDPYYQTGAVDQIHTSTNNIASIPNNHVVTIEAIANYLYGPSFTFQVAIPIDTTPPLTGLWETQHIVPVNPSTIHFV